MPTTTIRITNDIIAEKPKRLGINIGFHNQYGSSQILKNVIVNPGFEGAEFGTIFLTAASSDGRRVQADHWNTAWNNDDLAIGQPVGFWNGAQYEIVDGAAKGRSGNIATFTHQNGRYTYTLSNNGTPVDAADVVFVRQQLGTYGDGRNPFALGDPNVSRPGSFGTQSLRLLKPVPDYRWSYEYFLDSYWRDADPTAGKLVMADGEWRLLFWARGADPDSTLQVQFSRGANEIYYDRLIELNDNWRLINLSVNIPFGTDPSPDDPTVGPRDILALRFRYTNDNGGWLDDMAFTRGDQNNPTVFSDEYVNLLKELNPGVLRDWGHQLGNSLDNQLATPYARKASGHSPRYRFGHSWHYSLHEFLELCQYMKVEPWYVIPPTFTTTDLRNLAAYLAAPVGESVYADTRDFLGQPEPWTDVFETIHLEYGNEMWGSNLGDDAFIGATLRGGERLGRVSSARLGEFRASVHYQNNVDKFNLIVGGQAGYPPRQDEVDEISTNHDTIAIAPYFGHLDIYGNDAQIYQPLFANAVQEVVSGPVKSAMIDFAENGNETNLAIYEINFHTTTGDSPLDIRNRFVASLAGGLALPLHMLTFIREGVTGPQCAFTSAQFSFELPNRSGEYVRLWGMLRDMSATRRKRPTWLGVELANQAITGDMVRLIQTGDNPVWVQDPINHIDQPLGIPYIHAFGFKNGGEHRLVIFNLHLSEAQTIQLEMDGEPNQTAEIITLTADNINTNNEDSEDVSIESIPISDFSQTFSLVVPKHSLTVVKWNNFPHQVFIPIISTGTTPEP